MNAKLDIDPFQEACDVGRAFGIPHALVKASIDPFTYAVGLRDGRVIVFKSCSFDADHVFVTLKGVESHNIQAPADGYKRDHSFTFERGIDIRIVDILWAADAPWGS